MLELDEARARIFAALELLPAERVPLTAATGRILAEAVVSPMDLPGFDNSAMDGFAVHSADLKAASVEQPVALRVSGRVAAGDSFSGEVPCGGCVRVFTGSMLPTGADAVLMQEDTRPAAGQPEEILALDSVKPWENIRFRGEDVKKSTLLLAAGERIAPGHAGLLAAVGLGEITARRQPILGLLATGSELIEAGQPWSPGKIYESNRALLAPLLAQAGAVPRVFPLVPDTLAATEQALTRAFAECNGVVTSGGVSVGELDFVKQAFENLGGALEFWQVSMRPGKPFVFGRWGRKFLFGLPGNPVSAWVTFLMLVRPALLRWQGATQVELPRHFCPLAEPLVNRGDRRHFMRVRFDEQGRAHSAGVQASHMLSSLAGAEGLVEVPPGTTWPAGTTVAVRRLGD